VNRKTRLREIKKEALDHWKKYPVLADLYDKPEDYERFLKKIQIEEKRQWNNQ